MNIENNYTHYPLWIFSNLDILSIHKKNKSQYKIISCEYQKHKHNWVDFKTIEKLQENDSYLYFKFNCGLDSII